MEVLVNVIGQKLRISTNCKTFVDGTRNFIRFAFLLSDDWDDMNITAQFVQDGVAYNREIGEGRVAYLPNQIHDGKCGLLLRGTGGTVIAVTDMVELNIKGSNYNEGGEGDPIVFATLEEMKAYLGI